LGSRGNQGASLGILKGRSRALSDSLYLEIQFEAVPTTGERHEQRIHYCLVMAALFRIVFFAGIAR